MNWASRLTGRLSFSISMVPRSAAFVNGGGKVPAAPSHGLCGSAGGLPSQSPSGDSSPKGGAKYVRYQKLAQSQVSPPPLGEVSCLWHDGEGTPLARRPAFGKPPSWCAAVRERRGEAPVSLAFSHALRAYKGKVVRLRLTNRKLFEKSLTKNFYARYRSAPLCTCVA